MSSIEVAAAIFGIIGGVASAYKLARELGKRYQKRKKDKNAKENREVSERIEQRLKHIENQLKVSEAQLASLNRTTTASGNHAALSSDIAIQNVLTILQQISTVSTEDATRSPETLGLRELELYTNRWDWEASLISKTVCPNAVRYRQNLCQFVDVAAQQVPGSEWACRLCGIAVSGASMPFSRSFPYKGQVHITPNGFFKAHTTNGTSWSCVWKGRSKECVRIFEGRRALLQHMQSVHMRNDASANRLLLDGPADMREQSVAKCGYGILHPTKTLENAGNGFVMRFGSSELQELEI
jgi:hypothetical protein